MMNAQQMREKLESMIQLFLLDHGHAVEDEVISELVTKLIKFSVTEGRSLWPRKQ